MHRFSTALLATCLGFASTCYAQIISRAAAEPQVLLSSSEHEESNSAMESAFYLAPEVAGSSSQPVESVSPGIVNSEASSSKLAASTQSNHESPTSRWIELNTSSTSLRYRKTTEDAGINAFDFGQHREIADGRFKFDREGRYGVAFHASTGRYFNWAYADTIGGQFQDMEASLVSHYSPAMIARLNAANAVDPDASIFIKGVSSRGGYFYLRQLYASATPIDQVTVEFGSLPIEHGVNSEITSFDDDGYIAGERVRVHDKKHLYFDEVSATWAYIGDPFSPNFFARAERLKQDNYQQYLVKKDFGDRAFASADFTELRGTHSFREAVELKLPEMRVIDTTRVELYQRINDVAFYGIPAAAGSGFAASAAKTLRKKVRMEAGFAAIDNDYSAYSGSPILQVVAFSWNSDSFEMGKKAFVKVDWRVAPGLHLLSFYNHKIGDGPYTFDHQTLNAGFVYDFAEFMHSHKVF